MVQSAFFSDGVNGKEHDQSFAANGKESEESGKNGIAGSNGSPGGSFIGFWSERYFDELTKGELNLRANGGFGAAGQHGGNGIVLLLAVSSISKIATRKLYTF